MVVTVVVSGDVVVVMVVVTVREVVAVIGTGMVISDWSSLLGGGHEVKYIQRW